MNKQAKGKDPGLRDYGGPPIHAEISREQRDYGGWEPRQSDSKSTRPDLLNGAIRPPYFVQPGSDKDRPVPPKNTIEPVRSYGYAPPKREAPTKDIPAFGLPLSGEVDPGVGDRISQGRPVSPGNGQKVGPGGYGPQKFVTGPTPQAPPSASRRAPFDIVSAMKLPEREPADGPQVMGRNYPSFSQQHPVPAVTPGTEPGHGLFQRQRKPDPDETKAGNQ